MGLTLLAIRAEKNLSQIEAAKMAEISVGAYNNAENGKPISLRTAKRIGKAFDVDPFTLEGLQIAPRRIKRPKLVDNAV